MAWCAACIERIRWPIGPPTPNPNRIHIRRLARRSSFNGRPQKEKEGLATPIFGGWCSRELNRGLLALSRIQERKRKQCPSPSNSAGNDKQHLHSSNRMLLQRRLYTVQAIRQRYCNSRYPLVHASCDVSCLVAACKYESLVYSYSAHCLL